MEEMKKRGRPRKNQNTTIFSDDGNHIPEEHLDSEENKTNEISDLKNEYIEDKGQSEKKESKYKKSKRIEEEKEKQKRESISGFGSIGLSIIIDRLPNSTPLSDLEKRNFDLAFDNLADKYFSKLGEWQEESAFVMVLAFIIIPRMNFGKKEIENGNTEKKND